MRIGIVGGAGFVGSHVAKLLSEADQDVTIMDIREPRWGTLVPEKVWFRRCDVTGSPLNFKGFDVVMNMAAVSNTQKAWNDPLGAMKMSAMGHTRVLEACLQGGVNRVVLASTSLLSALQLPMVGEWPVARRGLVGEGYVVDEESPFVLDTGVKGHPYLASKLTSEMMTRDYRKKGLDYTILRYGIQYGEGMTPGVLFHTFIKKALEGEPIIIDGDGQQWRQYMHVVDLAAAHIQMMVHWPSTQNKTLNVVPHEAVTVNDVVAAIEKVIGKKLKIEYGPAREGDIDVKFCLATKAQQAMRWFPIWTLEEGVRRTVNWYRSEGYGG